MHTHHQVEKIFNFTLLTVIILNDNGGGVVGSSLNTSGTNPLKAQCEMHIRLKSNAIINNRYLNAN